MRILGIDPGTLVVGYGCLEAAVQPGATGLVPLPLAQRASNVVVGVPSPASSLRTLQADVFRLGKGARTDRMAQLSLALERVLTDLQPSELALEEAFYGRSVQAALRIGESRGVVLAIAGRHGIPVFEYSPAKVKRSVTGNGQASKQQVAAMVTQQLGIEGVRLATDSTDALALALCHIEHRRCSALEGGG